MTIPRIRFRGAPGARAGVARGAAATALVLALALACAAAPAGAQTNRPRVGAQVRYWDFSNGNANRDVLFYAVPGQWHAQLEVWDFERGDDQVRLELGGYVKDGRRSTYSLLGRVEGDRRLDFEAETGQVLAGGLVARGLARLIAPFDDRRSLLWGGGLDRYYGDYSFFSASAYRDPRFGGLWTYVISNRLATGHSYLQLGVAPAEGRPPGYFVTAKIHWLVAGYERNDRYDFENLDNDIFTLGVEFPLPRGGAGE